MKRIAIAVLPAAAAFAMFNAFAAITVHSTYNENTGQWEGNFDELTNAVKSSGTWATINLEKGVYDLSPLTNAPMSTSTYQGPSLLALQVGTDIRGATGNREDVVLKGPGLYRILVYPGGCKFRHLTFEGGYAVSGCTVSRGGAVFPTGGSEALFTNCLFRFNTAHGNGGAVCGTASYRACLFYGNVAGTGYGFGGAGWGGKYYNCQVISNACVIGSDWGEGGGLHSATVVSGCTVVSNFSTRSGGGLYGCSGVTNSYIAFNATKGQYSPRGGGLYNCGTITNCTVEYNLAGSGSGCGMVDTSAYGSTFRFNGASHYYHDSAAYTNSFERCDLSGSGLEGIALVDSCRIHHVSNAFDVIDNVTFGPCVKGVTYPFYNTRHVRNSLIDHCWITNGSNHAAFYSNGRVATLVENCTIVDNLFTFTLRGYTNTPATATFVNTAFARNKRGSTAYDFTGYESRANSMTNCILGVRALSQLDGFSDVNTKVKGADWDPRFVGSGEHPYEPKRTSELREQGLVLDWMEDADDLAGNARLRDGKVDIGCYQCWLNPLGTVYSIR